MSGASNWTDTTLGQLGKWGSGGTPTSTEPTYYGGSIPWIRSGDLPNGPVRTAIATITDLGLRSSSAKWVPADSVLVAMYGATIGKLGITKFPVTTNQAVAYCVPDSTKVTAEFLFWFLRCSRQQLIDLGQRGAQPNISQTILKDYPIRLPPLDVQRDIVTKVGRLTAASQRVREELDPVPKLVERYKQAVLAAAFRGDLTADWRKHRDIHGGATWPIESLGDLVLDVRYGTSRKCHYEPKATPVLRIPNVAAGSIDTTEMKYAHFDQNETGKLSLQPGDLLVIRSNGSLDLVGRVALATDKVTGFLFAGYLIRLRADRHKVLPEFLAYAFEEPSIRNAVQRFAKSTSGVNNINSEQLRSLDIPLPSLPEQQEIVSRLGKAMSDIGVIAAEATNAAALIGRLDRATLSKAFEGELRAE
jgi:type I restriction enzyme S subunit